MSARSLILCGATALALAMVLPGIAEAQSVTVVRGSEVSLVQGPDGFAEEARREVEPLTRAPSADRLPRASEEAPPPDVVVIVSIQDAPRTAWLLIDPWEAHGIRVHGMRKLHRGSRWAFGGRGGRFARVTPAGGRPLQRPSMRTH